RVLARDRLRRRGSRRSAVERCRRAPTEPGEPSQDAGRECGSPDGGGTCGSHQPVSGTVGRPDAARRTAAPGSRRGERVIRTNLSTRPFYNERLVHTWLIAVAVAVLAATAFNASRVLRYSRSDTRLATQASGDESRAADLRRQAARLRASVDPRQVDFAAADARQANDLIDRRTFSWTELFNRFETTLPHHARIASV